MKYIQTNKQKSKKRITIDRSINTQVNRHIHTWRTGEQLLYSHDTETGASHNSCSSNQVLHICRGVEGKQVGSMDEESQVRGCYNITFICTPTNPGNSVGSPLNEHRPQQQTNNLPLQGHWGKRDAAGDDELMLNVLRCQLTY